MSLVQQFLFSHRKEPDMLVYSEELEKLMATHEERETIGVI